MSTKRHAVIAFVRLRRSNSVVMNNTFQQFVRDEMAPLTRKFDVRADGEEGWVLSLDSEESAIETCASIP